MWTFRGRLAGVDDSDAVRRIRKECYRRGDTVRGALPVLLATACAAGVLAGAVIMLLRLRGGGAAVTTGVCTATAVGVGYWWHGRRCARALPDVLRAMGRCARCGYDLHGAEVCPECGQPASRA
jgi:hypothetical protein